METKYLVYYYSVDAEGEASEITQPDDVSFLTYINTPPLLPRIGEHVGFVVGGPR